jgi:hypothetical protein
MKKIIISLFLLLTVLISAGQNVQFSAAVISSGGGSPSTEAIHVSRWRIGKIHVVTFPSDPVPLKYATTDPLVKPEGGPADWIATVYPNPVNSLLKIKIDSGHSGDYAFEVLDTTGRKLIAEKAGHILPGQVVELDFAGFPPGLYLLSIIPSGEVSPRLFKITKE